MLYQINRPDVGSGVGSQESKLNEPVKAKLHASFQQVFRIVTKSCISARFHLNALFARVVVLRCAEKVFGTLKPG